MFVLNQVEEIKLKYRQLRKIARHCIQPDFKLLIIKFKAGFLLLIISFKWEFSKNQGDIKSVTKHFCLSLHEQIIVIKRNFSKFMVWDNVSIAKIQAPKIDSFLGSSSQEQVLYDGILLEYKPQTYMQVIFYFKQHQIFIPNKIIVNSEQLSGHPQPKHQLHVQIMCIFQTQPNQKLKQLLDKNKTPQQIESFMKRFKINDLRFKKSQWQVSLKGQKQIEQLLLNISDNQYIQSELTKILKQKPHDLQFLITIQKKQIQRYRFMLTGRLLKFQQDSRSLKKMKVNLQNLMYAAISQLYVMRQLDQIKLAIKYLLQSKMFEKKLNYSLNFMTFKQYDFIEIGKLKAVSLRQEIKLLGVKGFEKRLKYFVNSFKYLVLDDFRQILRFVIADLNQQQIKLFFIKNFPFILPSNVEHDGQDKCKLWQDTFQQDQQQNRIQTIELFKNEINTQVLKFGAAAVTLKIPLPKAIQAFDKLFNQFIKDSWFVQNSYKQHSLLRHNIQQLRQIFKQLKQVGVYNIIMEIMYQKIQCKQYSQQKVKSVIQALKNLKYLSAEYTLNIQSRLQIYDYLIAKVKVNRKEYVDLQMPTRSKFIILKQSHFFSFIFSNFPQYIIQPIQNIYEAKKKGLFKQNFIKFLHSPFVKLQKLISFVDHFKSYYHQSQVIRMEVFQQICKMMDIKDTTNSLNLLNKLKQMPIMLVKQPQKQKYKSKKQKQDLSFEKLTDQAKLAFAVYFSNLFKKFELCYTFSELISETNSPSIQQTKVLNQLICKYTKIVCRQLTDSIQFQDIQFIQQPICTIQLSQILDYLSVLLYLHSMLNYQFPNVQIYRKVLFQLFEIKKFDQVRVFIEQITEFGKLFDDRDLAQRYPHYRLLNVFKHENDVKKIFEDVLLEWINKKYVYLVDLIKQKQSFHLSILGPKPIKQKSSIQSQNKEKNQNQQIDIDKTINQTFFCISALLKVLNYYNFNERVEKQVRRISLFQNIKQLSLKLLCSFFPSLIEQEHKYQNISSFIFLANLLNKLQKIQPNIFNIHGKQQILQKISYMSKIHKQYVLVYQDKNKKSQQILLGQYCRFNSQFVVKLLDLRCPRFAGFVLIDLINSSYYYRDVLFYFLARMIDSKKIQERNVGKIVYEFISIENINELRKILSNFIVRFELEQMVEQSHYIQNVKLIFSQILKCNLLDQAFFFAIRNTKVQLQSFQNAALSANKFRQDHIITQTLLVAFVRATKENIEGQNSPTFMMYKRRLNCLMRTMQRMQVIKDIFIVISRLQINQLNKKLEQKETQLKNVITPITKKSNTLLPTPSNKQLQLRVESNVNITSMTKLPQVQQSTSLIKLKKYYEKYMQIENLNPWLTINTQQIQPSAIRLQKYPQYTIDERKSKEEYFKILPILRQQESKQIKQLRKKLLDNQERLRQIQETNRQLLDEQLTPAITQAKISNQKQYLSLVQRKKKRKQDQEEQVMKKKAENKQMQEQQSELQFIGQAEILQKLNLQQKQKINQIKKTYTSKIVKQTQNLINQLRERRKKVKQQTTATLGSQYGQRRKEQDKSAPPLSAKNSQRNDKSGFNFVEVYKQEMKHSIVFGSKINHLSSITSKQKNKPQEQIRKSATDIRDERKQKIEQLKQSTLRVGSINRLMLDKNSEYYVPRWHQKIPMRLQVDQILQQKSRKSSDIFKSKRLKSEGLQKQTQHAIDKQKQRPKGRLIESKVFDRQKQAQKQKLKQRLNEKQKQKQREKQRLAKKQKQKKPSKQQILQKYISLHQPTIQKHIQKLSMVITNPTASAQILKTIYSQIKQIKNFVELCKDLLLFSQSANEFIEHKSIKILQESLRIKLDVPFKQVFPIQFFTSVHNVALRDYYQIAYDIIRPCLVKVMGQGTCPANTLAMVIRFGFGSDNSFSYKVYQDYIRSLLQNYQGKSQFEFVEKDRILLAEKLRTSYNNLNPGDRKTKLQQLINQVRSLEKRRLIVKAMIANLENKSTLVNKDTYEELRLILTKINKLISH